MFLLLIIVQKKYFCDNIHLTYRDTLDSFAALTLKDLHDFNYAECGKNASYLSELF